MARARRSTFMSSQLSEKTIKSVLPTGIYSIFILSESGCPFFYKVYNPCQKELDPAILGGFFTALSLFAKEITSAPLETITTGPCLYTFQALQRGLLVLCSEKDFNPIILERIIKRIVRLFLTKFKTFPLEAYSASKHAPNLGNHIDQIFFEVIDNVSGVTT